MSLPSWQPTLDAFWPSKAGHDLHVFLGTQSKSNSAIYPPPEIDPLRALALTPLHTVRVVILGQDPYHGVDKKTGQAQAQGLAFSVPDGAAPPPSLRNIFKELARDVGVQIPMNGSLIPWTKQGVLLLNTCLTVAANQPASHAGQGWEVLTDALIAQVAQTQAHCVYLLWGAFAQRKKDLIASHAQVSGQDYLILQANHPSPLSALKPPTPFMGCGHFSKARDWLHARGHLLDWHL